MIWDILAVVASLSVVAWAVWAYVNNKKREKED